MTPDHEWTFDSKSPKSSSGNLKYSFHSKEPNWIEDKTRGGIVGDFNGANTCIDVHDSSGLFSVSKFTLSFFFKADKLSGTQGVVAHGPHTNFCYLPTLARKSLG